MISWLQTSFQHHFKTIFVILLAGTVIAFVFTIGAAPGIGHAERGTAVRQFFDLNLNRSEDQRILFADASLSAFLNTGYGNLGSDQLQMYALQRYAALSIARQLNLPEPTQQELSEFIKTRRPFLGQDGQFDPVAYNRFRENIRANGKGGEGDVARVLTADFRVERVNQLFSGPGYVMHADIAQQLARIETSWTLSTVTVAYDSFKPTLTPTDIELGKFFEENAFRYEIQPKFNGTYVEIPLSAYLPKVSVTGEEVRAFYEANQARFPAPVQAEGAPKLDAEGNFNAVKSQVELVLKTERARREAVKIASDVTVSLFEKKATAATINSLLAERGLTAKELTPFTQDAPPAELGGLPSVANEAFKLGADRLFTDALPTPAGAVILIWNSTIPSRRPELAEVREKVNADYIETERRKRFVAAGALLKSSVESRLNAGEAFAAAAEAAASSAGLKIEIKNVPAFSLRQPPQDLDYSIVATLERLSKGQISEMTVSAGKGHLVYAADKVVPDLSSANERYTEARQQIAMISSSATGSGLLSELVDRELKNSVPAAP